MWMQRGIPDPYWAITWTELKYINKKTTHLGPSSIEFESQFTHFL